MQISAKDLGWLATSYFCPRCFWIKIILKTDYLERLITPPKKNKNSLANLFVYGLIFCSRIIHDVYTFAFAFY